MPLITSKIIAEKLSEYLHHNLDITGLVDWAEDAMMEGDFQQEDFETIREIVSRLGVADVKAFGLTLDDCEDFLNRLGYGVHIEVVAN